MTRPSFSWQVHWPLTIFAFALLPCLLALGVWQLHRADEKRALQAQFDALRAAAPIGAAVLAADAPSYTHVELTGTLDTARSFLLDNRVLHGRVGFEVLTPFTIDGQTRVLFVNRGWIAGDPARQTLPVVPTLVGPVTLHGYLYRDPENHLVGADGPAAIWPRVIEQVDLPAMQQAVGATAFPFSLRLDKDSPAALAAEWPIVTSSPERHVAYAVQWFAMAAALVLLWLWQNSNLRDVLRRDPS